MRWRQTKPAARTLCIHERQKNHSKLCRGRGGCGGASKGCNTGCNATEVAATRAAVAPAADDLRLRGGRLQQQAAGLVEVRVRLQRPRELGRFRVRHQSFHSASGSVGHLRKARSSECPGRGSSRGLRQRVRPRPKLRSARCGADLGKRPRLECRRERERQIGGGPKQRGRADTRRDERRRVERKRGAPATGLTTQHLAVVVEAGGKQGWGRRHLSALPWPGGSAAAEKTAGQSEDHVTSLHAGRFDLRRAQGETRVRAAEDLRTQVARRVELRRQVCDELLRCQ